MKALDLLLPASVSDWRRRTIPAPSDATITFTSSPPGIGLSTVGSDLKGYLSTVGYGDYRFVT